MSYSNYDSFFEDIKNFSEKQNIQKQRGLNDYNLLNTVLKVEDEVRLHSPMIASLLDPKGLHYQNGLFIEKFFDEFDLNDFEMDIENISVCVEYKNIDIHITDGKKHIIIENKVRAGDQPCQIMRYINTIIGENKIGEDSLRVIYLTAQNKDFPDGHVVENGYITFDPDNISESNECFKLQNYRVKFQKIDYKNIFSWLQKCQYEVQNITNLNESIKQYMDVVQMINGEYRGKIVGLEELIMEDQDKFALSKELYMAYPKAMNKNKIDFFEKIKDGLSDIDIEVFSKEEIRLIIKKSPIHDIKLQVQCEKCEKYGTLSATLFLSDKTEDWLHNVYEDENEVKLSHFIDNTKNVKNRFKNWCYFSMNLNPNVNFKEKLFTDKDVNDTVQTLKSLYSDLVGLDLK